MTWNVVFYTTESGYCPIENFIFSINELKLRSKVFMDMELLEKNGDHIDNLFSKKINYSKVSIFELRTKQGTNIARIFYYFRKNNEIILLNGFIKKDQKTPKKEILLAHKYRRDWEMRQNA